MQVGNGGTSDAFVTKLNSTGSTRLYSTYLGGSGTDTATAIAVDGTGNAYVAGYTNSTNFPTTNPIQGTLAGDFDAFVTKINATGSARVYFTYLGGSLNDAARGIAVDGAGNAYVTGNTGSTNFPTTNPLQSSLGGSGGANDAFVTKINVAGSARVYSTYLGGSNSDLGQGIAVDGAGNAYVTGYTASTDFPTTNPIQGTFAGFFDAFVTKINAAGSAAVYSTYLGGSSNDIGQAIAVDPAGNAYVTGYTNSTNFPTTNPIQTTFAGGIGDAFVTKINATGSARLYSTYLGGSDDDRGTGIAVDSLGNAFVVGFTLSKNFPTRNPEQSSNPGFYNAFVFSLSGNPPVGVFRDTSGAVELTAELTTALSNAGGVFASDPSAAQNEFGDTYVVARDSSNAVWLNVYDARTRTWDGWSPAGATVRGVVAVAARLNTAYIVARDAFNAYWTNTFTRGSGFSGWVNRGGVFTTDPVIGTSPLSLFIVYVVGKDNSNAIWTAKLVETFSAWQLLGAVSAGNPSVTAGADGAGYIAIRDPSNALWMGRHNGISFDGWQPGGGTIATDPQIAAAGGNV